MATMPLRRGADGDTGRLLAVTNATTGAPPLRRDERDTDHAEPRARLADRARARLAWHGCLQTPDDLNRDTPLGTLTILAPAGLMSVAHARV
jgi:hypothetical protein